MLIRFEKWIYKNGVSVDFLVQIIRMFKQQGVVKCHKDKIYNINGVKLVLDNR